MILGCFLWRTYKYVYINGTQEQKAYLKSLQQLLLLFPSDPVKTFVVRVHASCVAAWRFVPRDGCASVLTCIRRPRHLGSPLCGQWFCLGDLWRVWSDCNFLNLEIYLWFCQMIWDSVFCFFLWISYWSFLIVADFVKALYLPINFRFFNWIPKAIEAYMWKKIIFLELLQWL